MGRHGMCEVEFDSQEAQWAYICYRGAIKSAIKGKRGQAFLKELINSLEALPEKKLIEDELEQDGMYCAIGSVGASRGIDMSNIDTYDSDEIAKIFGIAPSLVREIEWINDEHIYAGKDEDEDEERWKKVYNWAKANLEENI